MEFQRRRKTDTNIDMTPMIDTLLQLFVVFMLNMSFLASAVRLNLPRASAEQPAAADPIVVSLDAAARIFVNNEPVSRDELRVRLPALLSKSKERKVVLRADRGLRYEKVLEVLVAVQQAGGGHVSLAYEAQGERR